MKSTPKTVFAITLAALAIASSSLASAQQVIIIQPQNQYAASPCEYVANEVTAAIVEAEAKGRPVEETGRYQALRQNRQLAGFAISSLLPQAMDMVLNGASPRDVSDSIRIACNKLSRGY